jgi:predicted O-methyltransferase YrrM
MNPGEAETLLSLVRTVKPKRMLEIGVNEGLTAKYLLAHLPALVDYIGIDVLPGYVPGCRVQRGEVPRDPGHLVTDQRFMMILRPKGSIGIRPDQIGPVDVAFIDGDHSSKAVRHDSALAKQIVQPGGLIIWHDYHDIGNVDVRDVLHDLADTGREIVNIKGTWLAYERV